GAIKTTGTWDVGTRAGDFVFVAGMRGIDPKTNTLVQGDEARIRQAFLNMKLMAESEGASLRDCVRIVVFVTDMFRFRPIVNKVQEELWVNRVGTPIIFSRRVARYQYVVAAFNHAIIAQSLIDFSGHGCGGDRVRSAGCQKPHSDRRPLRTPRERPSGGRAPDKRFVLPPL